MQWLLLFFKRMAQRHLADGHNARSACHEYGVTMTSFRFPQSRCTDLQCQEYGVTMTSFRFLVPHPQADLNRDGTIDFREFVEFVDNRETALRACVENGRETFF
jgi:hypothetical protein